MTENSNSSKDRLNLKNFFIKLVAISIAIIIVINFLFNMMLAERLEKIDKILSISEPADRYELKEKFALKHKLALQIAEQRQTIENILDGTDDRLLVITGPCSIHDEKSALEYADRLIQLQEKVSDQIFLVMRAYIEKPRTTVGWKGFLYDPNLDGSANMQLGLEKSRQLYLQIIEKGLPIASEILSPMATAYFSNSLNPGVVFLVSNIFILYGFAIFAY